MMLLPGPLVGFLFDNHGPKYILLFGTVFHVLGLMLTSLCTECYQFLLAQGLCSPLGLNCIFSAATMVLPQWFTKKRGLAFGLVAAGSGLGGVVFPIMTSRLLPRIGFGWTLRAVAFLILGLLSVALVTVKTRVPPRPRAFRVAIFVEPFRDSKFVLLTVAAFLSYTGLFVPINFIESQAVAMGMSAALAGYLLAILNAASIFGRIVPGIMADKLGRFNVQTVMSTLTAITVLAIALPAKSNAALLVFVALYGFASGAYVSLLPVQLAYISKLEQFGVRNGVMFSCLAFAGLVGSPAAGAIFGGVGFVGMSIFAGIMLGAGVGMFVVVRMVLVRGAFWVKI